METIRSVVPLAALFVVCDLPWLAFVSPWFKTMFRKIQGGAPVQTRMWGAIPVYLALGWLLTRATSSSDAFLLGAAVYAVYDFTNFATIANYELQFAIADTLWGGVLAFITYRMAKWLGLL